MSFSWYNTNSVIKIKMKNKIIKLVSLVMMGVIMFGNSVAFANEQEVSVSSVSAVGHIHPHPATNTIDNDTTSYWFIGSNCNQLGVFNILEQSTVNL